MGSQRWGKANIWTQNSSLGDLNWHNSQGNPGMLLEATHVMLCMPLRGHTNHEMHPCGLIASEKGIYKIKLSHLVSNAWCLWIMHEYNFHVQAKNGFQYLWRKIQSHIYQWLIKQFPVCNKIPFSIMLIYVHTYMGICEVLLILLKNNITSWCQ